MNLTRSARYILLAFAVVFVTYHYGFTQGLSLLKGVIGFLFIISVTVFIHESGHFLVAKLSGVKIDTFSIGFGKELWGFNDRSGTRWKIAALPFGGYVKMFGDASEESMPVETIATFTEEEKRKTFYYKPLYKKAAIVAAGPIANFLLAIAIETVFIATIGIPSIEPVIGEVLKDSAAESAGLKPGDRILTVGDENISTFRDIQRAILLNIDTPVTLGIERGAQKLSVTLTPKQVSDKDPLGNEVKRPLIGIKNSNVKIEDIGPVRAVWEATREVYYTCVFNLQALGQMITGQRSPQDLTGPVGIAKLSGQAAQKGVAMVFSVMATISTSLGLINLFPIPPLDGGHLLYYGIEAVRGRPLARRFQEYGFRVGMAMIAMLMAFVILNDLRKLLLSA